jgi:hypothetical protein
MKSGVPVGADERFDHQAVRVEKEAPREMEERMISRKRSLPLPEAEAPRVLQQA